MHIEQNFQPSAFMEKPEINVSYMVTTAETKEEAEFEALPQDIWRLLFTKGQIGPLITPEEAQRLSINRNGSHDDSRKSQNSFSWSQQKKLQQLYKKSKCNLWI